MKIFDYKKIKKNNIPYIIAEIGVNHEGSIKRAKKLIYYAKKNGAHAAKFQTYKANKIAAKKSKFYWDVRKEPTRSQFELFSKYDCFNENDYKELAKYCRRVKIDFLSTPFDLDSVDFLHPLMPAYKISSSDITNYPLLKKISLKKKPIFLSTGASSLNEIKNAVNIFKKNKITKIVIMHCILNYPTKNINANLGMIESLKKEFPEYIIGYSDHTLPDKKMQNLCTAYILGAKIIEKHFTLNKKMKGNDHYHSMDKNDLKVLVKNIGKIKVSLGTSYKKKIIKSEYISRKNARRSIVLFHDVKKNQKLKKYDLICKRPGTGISPMYFNKIVGRRIKYNLKADRILTFRDIK
jgi:N-acetylneuraminate synthase|tara:strand:+ start:574 stop:1626 length:1053 start_codon:yes stop_codon:yes gene_type:complete